MRHHKNVRSVEEHQLVDTADVMSVNQQRAHAEDCQHLIADCEQAQNSLRQVADSKVLKARAYVCNILASLRKTCVVRVHSLMRAVISFDDKAGLSKESFIEVDARPKQAYEDASNEPADS